MTDMQKKSVRGWIVKGLEAMEKGDSSEMRRYGLELKRMHRITTNNNCSDRAAAFTFGELFVNKAAGKLPFYLR